MKTHFEVIFNSIFPIFFGPAAILMLQGTSFSFTRSKALNRDLSLRAVPSGPVRHFREQKLWLQPEAYEQALSQPQTPVLPACLTLA